MSNIAWHDEQNSSSSGGRRSQEGVEAVPQQRSREADMEESEAVPSGEA